MTWIDLKGKQLEAFRDALVSAFPDHGRLAMMARIALDTRLANVTAEKGLSQVAFELIEWAESSGQLDALLAGALRQNPGNPALLRFARELIERAASKGWLDELLVSAAGQSPEILHLVRELAPSQDAPPDTTPPTHTTTVTVGPGTQWLSGALIPIWRARPEVHKLRFDLPTGETRPLVLTEARRYYVGRRALRADETTPNDVVLPGVSRDAAVFERSGPDGRIAICNLSGKQPLRILADPEPVHQGASRLLRHGDTFGIGPIPGTFFDGRYYPTTPATSVDARTGLLSYEGLACEVALALASRKPRPLFLALLPGNDERAACEAAVVLHLRQPALPTARLGTCAAVLLDTGTDAAALLGALRSAGLAPIASGTLALTGPSNGAGARVEAALSAIVRLAKAGSDGQPADLAGYAIREAPLSELVALARGVRAAGGSGGSGLFVLEDLDRAGPFDEPTRAAIEIELREMVGSLLDPSDRVGHVAPGALAVATRGDVRRLLGEVSAAWRARGPIVVGALEIERGLRSFELSAESEERLIAYGEAFVRELSAGGDTQGLPLPIAYWVDAGSRAGSCLERARALVRAVDATWRFAAAVMIPVLWAPSAQKQPLKRTDEAREPYPWRTLALGAAAELASHPGRVGALASAIVSAFGGGSGPLAQAGERASALEAMLSAGVRDAASLDSPTRALEQALSQALGDLRALRGLSLVAVRDTEWLDVDGRAVQVDFVDYTGPHPLGTPRRNVVNGLRLGKFVYVVCWAERFAAALEPFVRCVPGEGTQAGELVFMDRFSGAPGPHAYRSALGARSLDLPVTERQLSR